MSLNRWRFKMGMYDEINFSCPKCDARVEFQSKAGECCLSSFHEGSVPVHIAEDIVGDTVACSCGAVCEAQISGSLPRQVGMHLKKVG